MTTRLFIIFYIPAIPIKSAWQSIGGEFVKSCLKWYAPKGQKLLAQGSALGVIHPKQSAL